MHNLIAFKTIRVSTYIRNHTALTRRPYESGWSTCEALAEAHNVTLDGLVREALAEGVPSDYKRISFAQSVLNAVHRGDMPGLLKKFIEQHHKELPSEFFVAP